MPWARADPKDPPDDPPASAARRRRPARRRRSALAACGEKQERRRRAAATERARRSCSTTSRTPTTPASTPRRRDGALRAGGPRRAIVHAVGPVGAAEAAARPAGRPRDLLRARAAARARQGRASSSRSARSCRQPLTSIMALGREDHAARRPARARRVGTAGIPYQTRLPADDPRAAPASPRRASRRSNVGFNLVPAMLSQARSTRRSARSGTTRASSSQRRRQATRRSSAMEQAGVPTYDELVLVAREQDARRRGARCGASCRRSRAATRRCATTPRRGVDRSSRPTRTSTAGCSSRASRRRCPPSSPPTRAKPFGYQDPTSGAPTDVDARQRAARASRRDARQRAHERVPAGRGARAAGGRRGASSARAAGRAARIA